MATYKLIQDIEAEDHILGPLTLRQFIYGLVAAFFYYICFILISKHVPILLILFLPIAIFLTFFAFPFKRDQPTEVWALAKLRFFLKPRRRVWSQSGIKDLVTITAPKKEEHHETKGLSESEVQNRLKSLALMIDTRGWAVKNVGEAPVGIFNDDTDRLISPGSIPKPVPDYDVAAEEDMLDDLNPHAMQVSSAINQSARLHRAQLMDKLGVLRGQAQTDEASLTQSLKERGSAGRLATSNMQHLDKTGSVPKIGDPKSQENPKTNHIDPAILNYALNNSGLSVQSLANEARGTSSDNEVVVNLH